MSHYDIVQLLLSDKKKLNVIFHYFVIFFCFAFFLMVDILNTVTSHEQGHQQAIKRCKKRSVSTEVLKK